MNWADTVRATALASLAEHTTTVARVFAKATSGWNPRDVWLSRSKPSGQRTDPPAVRDPATPVRRFVP